MLAFKHPFPLRGLLLLAIAAIAALAVGLHGPIPQPSGYHDFADGRSLGGIPHFADTLSNLPFLLVGVAGLVLFSRRIPRGALLALRPAYLSFFVGTALLFPGSAYYHLAPSDSTLAWDRLPMKCLAKNGPGGAEGGVHEEHLADSVPVST